MKPLNALQLRCSVTELGLYEESDSFFSCFPNKKYNQSRPGISRTGTVSCHSGKLHFYPFLQECIIDEDCETGKYCQFSTFEYKCQPCKTQHTVSPETICGFMESLKTYYVNY